jgi:aquaporin Z
MNQSLRQHWAEYAIEAWALGTFMVSASIFTALMEHPASPVLHLVPDDFLRRALIGLTMGLTAIALIYSPWGQRSGAHMNPATTLTFARLGKVQPWDAMFYIVAQFAGGAVGMMLSSLLLRDVLAHPTVRHVVTVPGPAGPWPAFVAETIMAAAMMFTVLWATNRPQLARFTGLFAGGLVCLFITFEARSLA